MSFHEVYAPLADNQTSYIKTCILNHLHCKLQITKQQVVACDANEQPGFFKLYLTSNQYLGIEQAKLLKMDVSIDFNPVQIKEIAKYNFNIDYEMSINDFSNGLKKLHIRGAK